jgi:hypothetical protein
MPYPPRPPPTHPHLPPSEARAAHLVPYRFQPGQCANPSRMSKSQRELYQEARGTGASLVRNSQSPRHRLPRILIRHE